MRQSQLSLTQDKSPKSLSRSDKMAGLNMESKNWSELWRYLCSLPCRLFTCRQLLKLIPFFHKNLRSTPSRYLPNESNLNTDFRTRSQNTTNLGQNKRNKSAQQRSYSDGLRKSNFGSQEENLGQNKPKNLLHESSAQQELVA